MKKNQSIAFTLALLLPALFFLSCQSTKVDGQIEITNQFIEETFSKEELPWEEITPGILRLTIEEKKIPQKLHLARIDLWEPGIELAVYPEEALQDISAKDVEKFAKERKCAVAMNAGPFDIPSFGKRKILGIHRTGFKTTSPANERYACMGFKRKSQEGKEILEAEIFQSQKEAEKSDCETLLAAYFVILKDGEKLPFKRESLDSRSAAGISSDKRFLYLLVSEGEERVRGRGISYQQCAEIFCKLGCSDALEFDGGASSMIYAGGKIQSYGTKDRTAVVLGFRKKGLY